jgi:hypothetical protein
VKTSVALANDARRALLQQGFSFIYGISREAPANDSVMISQRNRRVGGDFTRCAPTA